MKREGRWQKTLMRFAAVLLLCVLAALPLPAAAAETAGGAQGCEDAAAAASAAALLAGGKVAELRPHPLLQSPPSPRPYPSGARPLGPREA